MPIVVEHQPPLDLIGTAGYEGGRLSRAERDLDRRRQDYHQAAQQALQYRNLQQQAWNAERQRQVQAALEMQRSQQRSAEMGMRLGVEQQMAEEQQRAYQERAELAAETRQMAEVQKGIRDGVLRYTPQQEHRIGQLQNALVRIQTDPNYTPAQRREVGRRIMGELRQVQAAAVPVPLSQQPEPPVQQMAKSVVKGEDLAQQMGIDPKMYAGRLFQPITRNGSVHWEEIELKPLPGQKEAATAEAKAAVEQKEAQEKARGAQEKWRTNLQATAQKILKENRDRRSALIDSWRTARAAWEKEKAKWESETDENGEPGAKGSYPIPEPIPPQIYELSWDEAQKLAFQQVGPPPTPIQQSQAQPQGPQPEPAPGGGFFLPQQQQSPLGNLQPGDPGVRYMGAGDLARPQSKQDYDRMPSGTRFVAPDGSVRIKP